ncbi:MAG: low molecular weight phosphotyrosine protein phosphatase [Chlorobi bacterium]|nr:low molecular weight phosphotyrosine protein phosphatase [Chlorobiota bacterium]
MKKLPAKECRILFVCLGNICRSPMAEALLKKKLKDVPGVEVDSAGLDHYHLGEPPCRLTMTECARHDCYPQHRARLFKPEDFDRFDRIYVMDHYNLETVLKMAPGEEAAKKVKLILDEIYPGEHLEVPDPYMQGGEMIRTVYQLLDAATDRIAEKIRAGACP